LQGDVERLAGERYVRAGRLPGHVRWTAQRGSIYLADQKIPIEVPRVRDRLRNQEVPVPTRKSICPCCSPKHRLRALSFAKTGARLSSVALVTVSRAGRPDNRDRLAAPAGRLRTLARTSAALHLRSHVLAANRRLLPRSAAFAEGRRVHQGRHP
jgi:hypothetical protein